MELRKNSHPALTPLLLASPALADESFLLIDVGCHSGLDPVWRCFGDRLAAEAFDPQLDEIARLQAQETNPRVRYHGAYVGLEADHDFHREKRATVSPLADSHRWERFSTCTATRLETDDSLKRELLMGDLSKLRLAERRVSVSRFVRDEGIEDVDFVKIDTDGADLEVLLSCEPVIRPCGVLGFLVEASFAGGHYPTENSFHNIDRFLKRQGFVLCGLTINWYSRSALPAPFAYRMLAQTTWGQPVVGDALYFRDGAAANYSQVWGSDLPLAKVAKLAMLYELFGLPDCAAEMILRHREQFATLADPERLLDALTPPLGGTSYSYRAYTALFRENREAFFPPPAGTTLEAPGPGDVSDSPPEPPVRPPLPQKVRNAWGPLARLFSRRSA
jgi:FkbM family methyltransferase